MVKEHLQPADHGTDRRLDSLGSHYASTPNSSFSYSQQPAANQSTCTTSRPNSSHGVVFHTPQILTQAQRVQGGHHIAESRRSDDMNQDSRALRSLSAETDPMYDIQVCLGALTGIDEKKAKLALRLLQSTELGRSALAAWATDRRQAHGLSLTQNLQHPLEARNYSSPRERFARPHPPPDQQFHRSSCAMPATMQQLSPQWSPRNIQSASLSHVYQPSTGTLSRGTASPILQQTRQHSNVPASHPGVNHHKTFSAQRSVPNTVMQHMQAVESVPREIPASQQPAQTPRRPQKPSSNPNHKPSAELSRARPVRGAPAHPRLATGSRTSSGSWSPNCQPPSLPESVSSDAPQGWHNIVCLPTKIIKAAGLTTEENIEEWVTYRIDQQCTRYPKSRPPPQGTYKKAVDAFETDYSDPRDFHAQNEIEQDQVWDALSKTRLSFLRLTGNELDKRDMYFLDEGYNAAWDEIKRKASDLIWQIHELRTREVKKSSVVPAMPHIQPVLKSSCEVPGYAEFVQEQTTEGADAIRATLKTEKLFKNNELVWKPEDYLFKLERWYGLIGDYAQSPNFPPHTGTWDQDGSIKQNPDVFACKQCIEANVFCHGHRESTNGSCTPCAEAKEPCSKEQHRGMIIVEPRSACPAERRKRKLSMASWVPQQTAVKDDRLKK